MQYCDDGHRNLPRLRRQAPEPFLEIHPAAAGASGIEEGEWVVLETPAGAVTVKAKLNTSLDPSVVATQYGWWQECQQLAAPGYDPFRPAGANANLLIPDDVGRPDQRIGPAPQSAVPSPESVLDHTPYHHPAPVTVIVTKTPRNEPGMVGKAETAGRRKLRSAWA